MIIWLLSWVLNISAVHASIWDIGHWRDSIWGQIPGTWFGGFDFNQEIRNDWIYTKPNNSTIQLNESGDYLIIATTHDDDNSNGRYNSQLRVSQVAGVWDLFTSYYSWYSRDTSEDESWTRAISVIIGASANSQLQVQKRRDTDVPTWWSVANDSDVQVIKLDQTNYGIYGIWGTNNSYGWTVPNTVSIDSVVSESDILAIQGNVVTDTVTLRGDNKKYLVAWSTSFTGGGSRTQRVWHLDYNGVDALSTRSYCYKRNAANEYCGLGSMDVIETTAADITLQAEIFRGPWIWADQWGANSDQTMNTDGNGQMIVLEMPDYLEVFSSQDSVWLQDVTSAQTLNIARDVNISDSLSFTKNSNTLINVTNSSDIFSWANIWTARNNVASWARQTSFGSITLDWVEQSTWRHGNYSRWNQGVVDTFAMWFNPAGIFTTSWPWSTLWVNTDPISWGEAGWNDRTQPWTVWFFALNLDTLIAPEIDQSAYRFYENTDSTNVWAVLSAQNTPAVLSSDGEDFRLRSLINITQNKLRENEKDFKLQFAQQVGACDAWFIWEVYSDVTSSTDIAFNNNPTPWDEDNLAWNINDPSDGATPIINQSYQEANNFTTSESLIPQDQNGKWDFSLIDFSAPDNTTYCFRITESDGTLLNNYSIIPQITTSSTPLWPAAPGWVDTNLALWLKADEGTSTTTDWAGLSTWSDQSINWLDATAVNAPIYRNNISDELNFNPVIDFNGTNQYLENLANGAHSDSYYIVIVPDNEVEWTSSQGVPFGFQCTSGTLSAAWPCGLDFGGLALWAFTITIPDEVITHAIGSSANYRSSKTAVVVFPAWKPMLIWVNDNNTDSISEIYERWERVDNATRNVYQTLSDADYTIGRAPDDTYPFYYDGKIAEVINYDGGLTTIERQKIESYLAIKYWITLNYWTQNYIASDSSTLFWTTTTNTWFNNNIFWIGRDDLQELWQIKSKSVNDESIVTVEAVWEGSNISNSFSDISDKEFLMSWDNAGWNYWNAADAPAWFGLLDRKWKVQETGEVWTINLSFDVADPNFDVPNLWGGTEHYFVFDSDNDGSLADETPIAMTNTSGDIWETWSVNLNSWMLYTIWSEAGSNNIPSDIILSNDTVNENISAGSVLGSLTTTDADPSDVHSYSFVWWVGSSDNDRFTISWSNIIFNHSPDHEIQESYTIRIQTDDGNGGTYQEAFLITVNDLWEAITTTIDLENIEDEEKYTVWSGQWNNNTTNPNSGTNSLESNNLGLNNTQSCFQVEHDSATDWFVEFDYSVSSQAGSDELRFFIDNVQIDQWDGIIPYTTYTSAVQSAWPHIYKWCYVKDNAGSAGTDNAYIDNINFINWAGDTIDPVISSTSVASWSLLPWWNHSILIDYSDADSGIDTASYAYALNKWDGVSAYGWDISGASMSFISSSSTQTSLTFDDLEFGKYRFTFSIDDNAGNTDFTQIEFYIDEPEFIVSTPEIDLWTLSVWSETFSPIVVVTVRTVWAPYRVIMNRTSDFSQGTWNIQSWDSVSGYWYDADPLSWTISAIASSEIIASQLGAINTNGNLNTYTYNVQIGALIGDQQEAWDYIWNLSFGIELDYD